MKHKENCDSKKALDFKLKKQLETNASKDPL
jgi:hypothetical protein